MGLFNIIATRFCMWSDPGVCVQMLCRMKLQQCECVYLCVVWILVFLEIVQGQASFEQQLSKSSCLSRQQRQLQMQCQPGFMLRINRVFYGYSASGACNYQQGDCTLTNYQTYPCVGHEVCRINMPSGGFGRTLPACNQNANYFQVDYQCVPVSVTVNICQSGQVAEQSGHIISPRYPMNYQGRQVCATTIRVQKGQKIRLHVIDFDLEETRNSNCTDTLYVHDDLRSVTICGRRGNEELFKSGVNTLTVTFQAKNGAGNKGFWLYYEAFPKLGELTSPETPSPKSPPLVITDDMSYSDQGRSLSDAWGWAGTPTTGRPDHELLSIDQPIDVSNFPFAAIVGGVIGTLSMVLAVLLVLLVLKRIQDKRDEQMKKSKSFMEVQNHAFRSSGEMNPPDLYASNYLAV